MIGNDFKEGVHNLIDAAEVVLEGLVLCVVCV